MRHYEIVFLVHPDQSDQTQAVLNKFTSLVESSGGKVHRSEDIGSRRLAYPIQDQFKASYALLNVECNQEVLDEIKASFKFNDSIIRDLILTRKKEYSEISALSRQTEEDEERNKTNKSTSINKASSAQSEASDDSKKNKKEVQPETEDKNAEETE
ncbi:MAG: 30S ribosomal protein S6 [Gammaproteobacteria bacterium]